MPATAGWRTGDMATSPSIYALSVRAGREEIKRRAGAGADLSAHNSLSVRINSHLPTPQLFFLMDQGFLAQRLPELIVEVVEGAVEQLHGAVDEMAAAAAGQHDAEIFQRGEISHGAAPGVDPVQQAAHGGGANFARIALAARGVSEKA